MTRVPVLDGDEPLNTIGVVAAAAAIRSGQTTAEALMAACLDRIAAREPTVQAFAYCDPDHARAAARAADEAMRQGRGVGPLHGVPIAVKDVFETADQPTAFGAKAWAGRRTLADAAAVSRLKAAGAIILGKTATTELAMMSPAATTNPHDATCSPGGSSSGSAAAVADLMVPAALGTQTIGSVIRPASYCGVVGYKPSLGLIPRAGALMQSHSLDTVGVFARSVADAAAIADGLAAHDPADAMSYPRSAGSLYAMATAEPPVAPLFAMVKTPALEHASADARAAFEELREALGDRAQEIDLISLDGAIADVRTIQLAENASYYGRLLDRDGDSLSAASREHLAAGRAVPAHVYVDALRRREALADAIDDVMLDYSAIITLSATGCAPLLSEGHTGSPAFNGMWSYTGSPCISLPLLVVPGAGNKDMPLGVQVIGARRDDGRMLRAAHWLANHVAELS